MSASVFPARAGMSPRNWVASNADASVPRASGDEPNAVPETTDSVQCSPRERG